MDEASEADGPVWPEETVPILRVSDAGAALRWYERLGFEEEWTHRFEPGFPAFASIRRGTPGTGVRIFLSEHHGDAQPNGLLYLRLSDVAPVAAEFGVESTTPAPATRSAWSTRTATGSGSGPSRAGPSPGTPTPRTAARGPRR